MPQTLAVEQLQAVRLITLQRPQALNALNTELLGELALGRDGRPRGQVGDESEDLALDAVVLRDLHRTS